MSRAAASISNEKKSERPFGIISGRFLCFSVEKRLEVDDEWVLSVRKEDWRRGVHAFWPGQRVGGPRRSHGFSQK